jgi:hypothetical protein
MYILLGKFFSNWKNLIGWGTAASFWVLASKDTEDDSIRDSLDWE